MPRSPLLSRRVLALAAVVASLLAVFALAACGGDDSPDVDPAGAVPAAAPFYAEVAVRPEGELKEDVEAVLGKLLRTRDPGARIVQMLESGDKGGADVDFERDIEPWLGERVGLAITGIAPGSDEPEVLIVGSTSDADATRKAIAKDKDTTPRTYKGVSYRLDRSDGMALGMLGDDRVAMADERAFRAAVDAVKGQSLAEAQAFKDAREAFDADPFGFGYLGVEPLVTLITASGNMDPQEAALLRGAISSTGIRSLAMTLEAQADAVVVDAASLGRKGKGQGRARGNAAGALAEVPGDALAAIGLGDLGALGTDVLKQAAGAGGIGGVGVESLLNSLRQQLGLDVRRDLLSWMGDAAVFVTGDLSSLSGAVVIRSKNPSASQAAVPKIGQALRGLGQRVRPVASTGGGGGLSIGGGPLASRVRIVAQGDRFIVAFGPNGLQQALEPASRLGASPALRAAGAKLGKGVRPSFFADLPKVVTLIEAAAGDDPDFARAKPYLQALGALAGGVERRDGVTHVKAALLVR